MQNQSRLESGHLDVEIKFDDDGQIKRTGTWQTASSHIITTIIGSGVLSLAWCFAQLGWIPGITTLLLFSAVNIFTSSLLADSYRSPHGTRNYTYKDAVGANLGMQQYKICGIAQSCVLIGVTIGYTTTTAISMAAIHKAYCFHKHGHQADCLVRNNPFMIIFAVIEIVLSQVPNFHKLSPLSMIATIMSFMYSSIGIGLSIGKIAGNGVRKTSLTGIPIGNGMTGMEKMWRTLSAIGDVAFAFSFSFVLIEIQDTLKSSPPENKTMKKAATIGIICSTMFYLMCGVLGYAAFGNDAPGNFLTGFGFFDPFWLVGLANLCVAIHLLGAYQVIAQPLFAFMDEWSSKRWAESSFVKKRTTIGGLEYTLFRVIGRTTYVTLMTCIAMIFPFFNDFVGLLGACTFWPLSVYFPIQMYISQAKLQRSSVTWLSMQLIIITCFVVSLCAAVGSARGLVTSVSVFKPFRPSLKCLCNTGMQQYKICGIAQSCVLIGVTKGYTTTTAISMAAINKAYCFHKHGHQADCLVRNNPFMIIFAVIEIVLSQVPNFHKLSPLSMIATIMSFMYSSIGIGLSIGKIAGNGVRKTSLTGIPIGKGMTGMEKIWRTLSAIGDVAFAFSFSFVLIEIQDTLKSSPPENKTMKKAATIGIICSTMFYLMCGVLGYAAFGNDAPGNFLTGFGFFDPFWLVGLANLCVAIHLLGAYQVIAQPLFAFMDEWSSKRWAESSFVKKRTTIGGLEYTLFRVIGRTTYVTLMTCIAMIFPFFNDFVGLLGACTFWPLSVYFPIQMYISQAKLQRSSVTWLSMQLIIITCFVVSLCAAVGSARRLVTSVSVFKPFRSVS